MSGDNYSTIHVSNNRRVRFVEEENTIPNSEVAAGTGDVVRIEEDAIDTTSKSRSSFSKRDQIRADKVHRLQHVEAFKSEETLIFSVITNEIRNNPVNRRDIKMYNEMLGNKYLAQ